MKKEIKDLLIKLTDTNAPFYEIEILKIREKAQELIQEDLKEEVLNIFADGLVSESNYYKDFKKAIRDKDKISFIYETKYYKEQSDFIRENWNELDKILEILNEEIKRLEDEECSKNASE